MGNLSQTVVIGDTTTETQFYEQADISSPYLDRREIATTLFTLRTKASPVGSLTLRGRLNGLVTPVMEIVFPALPQNLSTVTGRLNYEVAFIPTTPNDATSVFIQVRGIGEYVNASNVLTPFTIATGANPETFDLTQYDDDEIKPTLRWSWQWATANAANVLTIYSHHQGRLN